MSVGSKEIALYVIDCSVTMGQPCCFTLGGRTTTATPLSVMLQYVKAKIAQRIMRDLKTTPCGVITYAVPMTKNVLTTLGKESGDYSKQTDAYRHYFEEIPISYVPEKGMINCLEAVLAGLGPDAKGKGWTADAHSAIILGMETIKRDVKSKNYKKKEVVLLTDGESVSDWDRWEETAAQLEANHISLIVVGMNFDDDDSDDADEGKSATKIENEKYLKKMVETVEELGGTGVFASATEALEAIAEPSVREVNSVSTATTLSLGDLDDPESSIKIGIDIKKAVSAAPVKSMKQMSMKGFVRTARGTSTQSPSRTASKRDRPAEDDDGETGGRIGNPRTSAWNSNGSSSAPPAFSMGNIGKSYGKTLEEAGLEEMGADSDSELTSHEVLRETRLYYRPLEVAKVSDLLEKKSDEEEPQPEPEERPVGEQVTLTEAYYYGGSLVDTGDLEPGTGLLTGNKTSMEIVGFVKHSHIRYDWRLNDLLYVYASAGMTGSQLMFSTLVNAMRESGTVAIVRYIAKGMNVKGVFRVPDPKLGLLYPATEAPDFCYWCQLPFAEDIRSISFPSLKHLFNRRGAPVTEHKTLPTQSMKDAMGAFVDAMDLVKKDGDDESDGPSSFFSVDESFSPAIHNIQNTLIFRLSNLEGELPPVPPVLTKFLDPPAEVTSRAREARENAIKAFDLKLGMSPTQWKVSSILFGVPLVPPKPKKISKKTANWGADATEDVNYDALFGGKEPTSTAFSSAPAGNTFDEIAASSQPEKTSPPLVERMDVDEPSTTEATVMPAPSSTPIVKSDEESEPEPDTEDEEDEDEKMPAAHAPLSISEQTPLKDFAASLKSHGSVAAIEAIASTIGRLVESSFSTSNYEEAINCINAAKVASEEINPEHALLMEQAVLKAPVDTLRKTQKVTQKTYEHNVGSPGSAFQKDLDDLLRKSAASASVPIAPDAQADMLKTVDSMLSRMRGLKRKLSDLSTQSDAAVHVARTRCSYLSSVPASMDDQSYTPWARQRLSHQLADYFLRSTPPLKGTALTFAKEEGIEELVDFELWDDLAKAEAGLREGRLDEVLAWTGENRSALRKARSPLEFNIHLQAYVELCRSRSYAPAIAYQKKHLSPIIAPESSDSLQRLEFERSCGLLIYPPGTTCSHYQPPKMSATPPQKSALARRTFVVGLVPAGPTPLHSRHLKRIHVAAEILKAAKICAGDALVVRIVDPTEGMESLSLDVAAKSSTGRLDSKFAIGVAWPSFTLSGTALALSPLLLANAGLNVGASVSISTLETSGIAVAEAERVSLIYDAKGKVGKDSFFESYAKEVVVDIKYVAVHHFVELTYNGIVRRLLVSLARPTPASSQSSTTPFQAFTVSRSTIITFKPPIAPLPRKRAPAAPQGPAAKDGDLPGYEMIGGMENQIEQIRELVEWPLTRPELYQHFGLRPPRGILLYGPPGTGKTLLALSIARSTKSTLLTINGPSLSSAYHGETEARLREVFAEAKRKSPAVIVIDEVDALAPNREEGGEVERRVVATLLMLMDGLDDKEEPTKVEGPDESDGDDEGEEPRVVEKPRVVVIAATNRPNAIDPALRRPGRFDKEIEIGVPDASSRLSILKVLLQRTPHELSDIVLQSVAARTHGFVGADLSSLVHSAGLSALKRSFALFSSIPVGSLPSANPALNNLRVNEADMESALLSTRPSAMREVFLETPKVYWNDIGGQAHIKDRLRECVEWPLLHPDTFKRLGVRPPRGILLYGPPGCSKTLIAKALATEGGLNFIAVKGPEVFNKYVGESEKAIRELFRKARAAAPSIIFLDEIDALAPARGSDESGGSTGDRVLMSLLTEMDGIEELNGVIVLAATNRPEIIDPALMRPGRLDRILYVSPPDLPSRRDIFRVNFAKMAVHEDVEIEELAVMTEGCSGAELVSICQDAALNAMNEDIKARNIARKHFVEAARTVRRRITREVIQSYEDWRDQSGLRSA
ncbi:AAA family ATPase, partial [Phenoliferia sp. Uapishka_3]